MRSAAGIFRSIAVIQSFCVRACHFFPALIRLLFANQVVHPSLMFFRLSPIKTAAGCKSSGPFAKGLKIPYSRICL
jgi:hypothetical protein